jgi:cobalt-zinc-cadmium efflux system protein
VEEELGSLSEVASVHDLHVWSLDGKTPILSAHLIKKPGRGSDSLLRDAEQLLAQRFGVTHSTLQIESPDAAPCRAQDCCNLLSPAPLSPSSPISREPLEQHS